MEEGIRLLNKKDLTHSNQYQQLLVTVSKHFYVQKEGSLAWQQKAFGVNINNSSKAKKELLVHYILRDAFSGSFYLELATTQTLLPLVNFLFSAWKKAEKKGLYCRCSKLRMKLQARARSQWGKGRRENRGVGRNSRNQRTCSRLSA